MEQGIGKKGIMILLIPILIVVAVCAVFLAERADKKSEELSEPLSDSRPDVSEELQEDNGYGEATRMMALADTREEAENIASLYEMELVDFSNGVAVYETTQDPYELMKMGEMKKYPTISIDHILTIDEEGKNEK